MTTRMRKCGEFDIKETFMSYKFENQIRKTLNKIRNTQKTCKR